MQYCQKNVIGETGGGNCRNPTDSNMCVNRALASPSPAPRPSLAEVALAKLDQSLREMQPTFDVLKAVVDGIKGFLYHFIFIHF